MEQGRYEVSDCVVHEQENMRQAGRLPYMHLIFRTDHGIDARSQGEVTGVDCAVVCKHIASSLPRGSGTSTTDSMLEYWQPVSRRTGTKASC
jgi:hypothetical protein